MHSGGYTRFSKGMEWKWNQSPSDNEISTWTNNLIQHIVPRRKSEAKRGKKNMRRT